MEVFKIEHEYKYRIERETTKDLRTLGRDFINTYHSYIKWADRPSRKLYWNLYEDDIMVGVFALSSAFDRPKLIKDYMQDNNLQFNEVANNIVYCLANHKNKNAGTIFLKLCRQDGIAWWYERYGDELKAFQTFILPPRVGAVYKADNWSYLGITSGKSKSVRALYGKEREEHPEAEVRTFKSGEVKYLLHEFKETDKKLIFMKLNKNKEINKIIHNNK